MPRKTARKKRIMVEKEVPQPAQEVPAQVEQELIVETDKTEPALEYKKKSFINRVTIISAVIVLIVVILPAVFFYNQYLKSQKTVKSNTAVAAQDEAKQLVAVVGKLIDLPQNEMPTIATVSDKTKLAGQAFFVKAENGDKVLIFASTKKAILYRPSTNKLIEVAAVSLQDTNPQSGASASPTSAANLKVIILNGTNTIGLTTRAESQLRSQLKNIEVVDRDNAKKRTYDKTIVVDIKGTNSNGANTLAKAIGAAVSSLPVGEATPLNADFVIILGSDFIK